eukprot:c23249_g1_i1 orf=191-376(-)
MSNVFYFVSVIHDEKLCIMQITNCCSSMQSLYQGYGNSFMHALVLLSFYCFLFSSSGILML